MLKRENQLLDELDAALKFCITEESKCSLDMVTNYEEVKAEITSALEIMRDNPKRRQATHLSP